MIVRPSRPGNHFDILPVSLSFSFSRVGYIRPRIRGSNRHPLSWPVAGFAAPIKGLTGRGLIPLGGPFSHPPSTSLSLSSFFPFLLFYLYFSVTRVINSRLSLSISLPFGPISYLLHARKILLSSFLSLFLRGKFLFLSLSRRFSSSRLIHLSTIDL